MFTASEAQPLLSGTKTSDSDLEAQEERPIPLWQLIFCSASGSRSDCTYGYERLAHQEEDEITIAENDAAQDPGRGQEESEAMASKRMQSAATHATSSLRIINMNILERLEMCAGQAQRKKSIMSLPGVHWPPAVKKAVSTVTAPFAFDFHIKANILLLSASLKVEVIEPVKRFQYFTGLFLVLGSVVLPYLMVNHLWTSSYVWKVAYITKWEETKTRCFVAWVAVFIVWSGFMATIRMLSILTLIVTLAILTTGYTIFTLFLFAMPFFARVLGLMNYEAFRKHEDNAFFLGLRVKIHRAAIMIAMLFYLPTARYTFQLYQLHILQTSYWDLNKVDQVCTAIFLTEGFLFLLVLPMYVVHGIRKVNHAANNQWGRLVLKRMEFEVTSTIILGTKLTKTELEDKYGEEELEEQGFRILRPLSNVVRAFTPAKKNLEGKMEYPFVTKLPITWSSTGCLKEHVFSFTGMYADYQPILLLHEYEDVQKKAGALLKSEIKKERPWCPSCMHILCRCCCGQKDFEKLHELQVWKQKLTVAERDNKRDLRTNLQLGMLEKKDYVFRTMRLPFKPKHCFWILVANFVDKIGLEAILAFLTGYEITGDETLFVGLEVASVAVAVMNLTIFISSLLVQPYRDWEETVLDLGNRFALCVDSVMAMTIFCESFITARFSSLSHDSLREIRQICVCIMLSILCANIMLALWCLKPLSVVRMLHKYWLLVIANVKQMGEQRRDDLERNMLRLISSVYSGDNDGVSECLAQSFKVDFSVCFNTIDGGKTWSIDGSHKGLLEATLRSNTAKRRVTFQVGSDPLDVEWPDYGVGDDHSGVFFILDQSTYQVLEKTSLYLSWSDHIEQLRIFLQRQEPGRILLAAAGNCETDSLPWKYFQNYGHTGEPQPELSGSGGFCFIGCKGAKQGTLLFTCETDETRRGVLELVRRIDAASFEFEVKNVKVSNNPMEEFERQLSQWTVVHEAVRRGQSFALSACLAQGASAIATARGASGEDVRPLMLAYQLMSLKCAELLESVGAYGALEDGKPKDTWPVFDDMFHSSAESTALIPMRRSLMTLAAKAGPQRFDDIKMASNAYPVCLKEEGQTWYIEMLRQNLYEGACVIFGVMQLKFVDLSLASVSLSTANLNLLLKAVHVEQLPMRYLKVSRAVEGLEDSIRAFPGGLENRGLLLLLAQKLTVHEARELEALYNESSNLIMEYKACEDLKLVEVAELISAFPDAKEHFFSACFSKYQIAEELAAFGSWKGRYPHLRKESDIVAKTKTVLGESTLGFGTAPCALSRVRVNGIGGFEFLWPLTR